MVYHIMAAYPPHQKEMSVEEIWEVRRKGDQPEWKDLSKEEQEEHHDRLILEHKLEVAQINLVHHKIVKEVNKMRPDYAELLGDNGTKSEPEPAAEVV